MDADCIFCKIIRGEIPSLKVHEDDATFAFLDIHPVNLGHTLVIPKRHSRNLLEIPESELSAVAARAKKIAAALMDTGAAGVNVIMNTEKPAGQIIFHTHCHVIPRYEGDGFTHWRGAPQTDEAMQAKQAELAARL